MCVNSIQNRNKNLSHIYNVFVEEVAIKVQSIQKYSENKKSLPSFTMHV
jgi:hypothetical protein